MKVVARASDLRRMRLHFMRDAHAIALHGSKVAGSVSRVTTTSGQRIVRKRPIMVEIIAVLSSLSLLPAGGVQAEMANSRGMAIVVAPLTLSSALAGTRIKFRAPRMACSMRLLASWLFPETTVVMTSPTSLSLCTTLGLRSP